jgi:hypothetical protein
MARSDCHRVRRSPGPSTDSVGSLAFGIRILRRDAAGTTLRAPASGLLVAEIVVETVVVLAR